MASLDREAQCNGLTGHLWRTINGEIEKDSLCNCGRRVWYEINDTVPSPLEEALILGIACFPVTAQRSEDLRHPETGWEADFSGPPST